MNNKFQELKLKFFKPGDPIFLYIGINVLVFVAVSLAAVLFFFSGSSGAVEQFIAQYLAFPSAPSAWLTKGYTILTYQFFHDRFFQLFFNMLWLYWMGQIFLDFLKPRQFHFIYLGGGIAGALFFALVYNLVPPFNTSGNTELLIGSSAAVMAIFTAITTLIPNYSIRMFFVGEVKLKYLLLVYAFLDLITTTSYNPGDLIISIAHFGGMIFGFVYIKMLQKGVDFSAIFKKRTKLKVVKNDAPRKTTNTVNQKEVDAVLDKISKTGYDKLTKEEKDILFRASKH